MYLFDYEVGIAHYIIPMVEMIWVARKDPAYLVEDHMQGFLSGVAQFVPVLLVHSRSQEVLSAVRVFMVWAVCFPPLYKQGFG